jgi:hypothetical protein
MERVNDSSGRPRTVPPYQYQLFIMVEVAILVSEHELGGTHLIPFA